MTDWAQVSRIVIFLALILYLMPIVSAMIYTVARGLEGGRQRREARGKAMKRGRHE